MAAINPFSGDQASDEVWVQGYMAGFNNPTDEPFRPFAPNLLEVHQRGFENGAADRQTGPEDGLSWVSALGDFVVEEGMLPAIGVGLENLGFEVGGVIGLVLSVVNPRGRPASTH